MPSRSHDDAGHVLVASWNRDVGVVVLFLSVSTNFVRPVSSVLERMSPFQLFPSVSNCFNV